MQGVITNYNSEKGYGFIYSEEYEDDIFVHISKVTNASTLSQGQNVTFEVTKTQKGFSATSVIAGDKQYSPYLIFGVISALISIAIFGYLYRASSLKPILSYFISINITVFLIYGYDKFISSRDGLRVPEWNLHILAIIGGSPVALASQKFFRHKTIKGSFQLVYWLIVLVQVVVVVAFWS